MVAWNSELQRRKEAELRGEALEKHRKGGINSAQLVEIQEAIESGNIEEAKDLLADYGNYYHNEY